MTEQEIIQLIDNRITASQREALYGTSNKSYHTHNNIDSPIIPFVALGGVPNNYTNSAGKALVANSSATGLIFGGKLGTGGPLFDHYADGNNTNTSETDLYTDTLAAGQLATNGDKIWARYQGIFTGAATSTQELRAYFGGTKIYDSGALSIGVATDNWTLNVLVIRESSTVVRCSVFASSDFATTFPYSTYTRITGLTLSNTQILKITGQAAGAGGASSQITAKLGSVSYEVAA